MAYLTKEHQVKSFKPKKKHKSKKAKTKTPRPTGKYQCAGCSSTKYLQIHHVFYGRGQRDSSSKYGCVEWLEFHCHQDSYGIHGSKSPNMELDYELKVKHQRRLLNNGMTLKEFRNLFGMDYDGMGWKGYYSYRTKKLGVVMMFDNFKKWLEPKCDLCGKPGTLYSDGIGLSAHRSCWSKVDTECDHDFDNTDGEIKCSKCGKKWSD